MAGRRLFLDLGGGDGVGGVGGMSGVGSSILSGMYV